MTAIVDVLLSEGKVVLDGLNKFGLPAKYGIVGFFVGLLGAFLAQMLGVHGGELPSYLATMLATGVGGTIGGWVRQHRGMTN